MNLNTTYLDGQTLGEIKPYQLIFFPLEAWMNGFYFEMTLQQFGIGGIYLIQSAINESLITIDDAMVNRLVFYKVNDWVNAAPTEWFIINERMDENKTLKDNHIMYAAPESKPFTSGIYGVEVRWPHAKFYRNNTLLLSSDAFESYQNPLVSIKLNHNTHSTALCLALEYEYSSKKLNAYANFGGAPFTYPSPNQYKSVQYYLGSKILYKQNNASIFGCLSTN